MRFLIVSGANNLSLGVYVRIKKSFEPYLIFTSRKYFKSGSFSKRRVSDEASSSKFLAKYPKLNRTRIKIVNTSFGLPITLFS